ncbi:MAG: peptidylprolyl isomerase [Clostridia bacterium]|nr:peptidylprolyl isomerase [Clostridia bacterium]
MKKIVSLFLALVLLTLPLIGCGAKKSSVLDLSQCRTERLDPVDYETNYVQIELECGAYIVIELYPDIAPITVENFKKLVSEKFYDGIIFHRVINGFMIQGGDPEGTGMGGSPNKIQGEFASNGVANPISHTTGVVSMARRGNDKNSASSQFFIMHKTATHLDGDYAAFGKVWRGIETVNQIASVPTDGSDKPLTDVVIKTMSFVEIPQ